jgi:hypothetical protein
MHTHILNFKKLKIEDIVRSLKQKAIKINDINYVESLVILGDNEQCIKIFEHLEKALGGKTILFLIQNSSIETFSKTSFELTGLFNQQDLVNYILYKLNCLVQFQKSALPKNKLAETMFLAAKEFVSLVTKSQYH